jgi:general secretion pathway protein M
MNLAWIEPWRAQWKALGARERRTFAALAVVLGAVLLYLGVWSPVQSGIVRARERVASTQIQLSQVREQAALVERARNAPRPTLPSDAAAAVGQAAARYGMRERLKRVDPEGVRAVRVQIEEAPFVAVMAWLNDLQQQSGLRAESATFERHPNPGAVNARLLLRAPGS